MTAGDGSVEAAARIVLRPIANPLPLGFLALAGGTTIVSGLQLGWVPPAQGGQVALILLAFVAPLQLLAAVFGFLGRDVVAGTGMGLLAGTWLAVSLVVRDGPPGSTSDALGLFLLVAGASLLVPALAAAPAKAVPAAVIAVSAVRVALTGVHQLTADGTWQDVAGVAGLVLAALAAYAALALALEDAQRRTVLPLGRRALAREAMEGGLAPQVRGIEHEAGIREQL